MASVSLKPPAPVPLNSPALVPLKSPAPVPLLTPTPLLAPIAEVADFPIFFRRTCGADGMLVLSFALPMLKTGDSQRSPLAANSLYSVAFVEIPDGRLTSGKMESCFVMAMLNFLPSVFASISLAFCLARIQRLFAESQYLW